LGHYHGVCLKGLGKDTKSLSQDSWCPDRDLNTRYGQYEAVSGMLSILSRTSRHNVDRKMDELGAACNTINAANNK
jgi:hypothetical protein